jgi:hypothetical protein
VDRNQLSTTDIDTFERLMKQVAPNEAPQIVALVKKLRADLVTANKRAMDVHKELRLPAGTIVITPDAKYGVIGKDGALDPSSVRALNPHEADAVGGIFYTPSKRPVGSDGSGQSLIGPGFVNQDGSVVGKRGLAKAITDAQRSVEGAGSLRGAIEQAQENARGGVVLS